MGSIKEPPGTFFLNGYIFCHIFQKLINQCGSFENTVKFNWQPMERIVDACEYLLHFVTILQSVFKYIAVCAC